MEIEITHLFDEVLDSYRLMDSIARSGIANIGQITWNNALALAAEVDLPGYDHDAAREWLLDFGAWELDELDAETCKALTLQMIASDYQEWYDYMTPEDYEAAADEGSVSGSIFQAGDGRLYYLAGN